MGETRERVESDASRAIPGPSRDFFAYKNILQQLPTYIYPVSAGYSAAELPPAVLARGWRAGN